MSKLFHSISTTEPFADKSLSNALVQNILSTQNTNFDFVFFCIGTTHVVGDSLGPLIGSQLKSLHLPNITVYGTLEHPVHALNVVQVWTQAKKKHPGACFIAIDASFGPKTLLGNICIENCPIYPGQGVGKSLPPIGDISITGIVCHDCLLRHRQLEKTPISFIKRQANIITSGIFQTIFYLFILRKP